MMAKAAMPKAVTRIPAGSSSGALIQLPPPRLPYHPDLNARFGVDATGWRALTDAVWPGAKTVNGVVLALSICKARHLDPFKRPVHIVPIWSTALGAEVESVWPGIGELRTTAFRTGLYAGRDPTIFGPDQTHNMDGTEITFPEWAQITVYRFARGGSSRMAFPGPRVYWMETYATAKRDTIRPNAMWTKRPRGQIDKCAEAAALRGAFPEEIGEYTAEEMEGQIVDAYGPPPPRPRREAEVSGPSTTSVAEEPKLHTPAAGEEADDPRTETLIFEVVDFDGVVHEHGDAPAARSALLALIDEAKRRGLPAVKGLWESHAETVKAIGEAIEDGAEPLHKAYAEALASFEMKLAADRLAVPIRQGDWAGTAKDMLAAIAKLTDPVDTSPTGRFKQANQKSLDDMRRFNRELWGSVEYGLGDRDRELRERKQPGLPV
jgi:phage recombination protein Bet